MLLDNASRPVNSGVRRLLLIEVENETESILSIASVAVVLVLAFAIIWKQTWMVSSIDGASDSDKGVAFSGRVWNSLDGEAQIFETRVNYSSQEDARKGFENELKDKVTIIERTKFSEFDERIVVVEGNPETKGGAATIIRLQNKEIRYVNAASLKYVLAFERAWIKLG